MLLDTELTCLLPAQAYPFNQPGAGTNPWVYLEQLEKWSDAGTVLRFVVSGTPVNAAVLLDPIRYREQDGTGDLYCTIPLRGYRALAAETTESRRTGNGARTVEAEPERAETYTVAAGDTLSAICRRFYGDASLYRAPGGGQRDRQPQPHPPRPGAQAPPGRSCRRRRRPPGPRKRRRRRYMGGTRRRENPI